MLEQQTEKENEKVRETLSKYFYLCIDGAAQAPTSNPNKPISPVELFGDMFRTE